MTTRIPAVLAGVVYLAGAFAALWSINSPSNPAELTIDYQWALADFWPAVILSMAVMVVLLAVFFPKMREVGSRFLLGMSCASAFLGLLAWFVPWAAVNPWQYYNARGLGGVLLFLVLAVLAVIRCSPDSISAMDARVLNQSLAAFFFAVVLVMGSVMVGFSTWVERVQCTVREGTGIIPIETTDLDSLYKWDWALPSLSLLLREDPNQGVVVPVEEYADQLPFDPRLELPELPYP